MTRNGRYAHFLWLENRSARTDMNRKELEIESLLANSVASQGCEIWGVELSQAGKHTRLRLYIDKPDGVTIDDCEKVSRQVSDVLDVSEALTSQYTLEVSSPGMDRTLFRGSQYLDSVGEQVEVRLNFPFEGKKRIVGLLAGYENDEVIVQSEGEEFLLPVENVQKARIVPSFD